MDVEHEPFSLYGMGGFGLGLGLPFSLYGMGPTNPCSCGNIILLSVMVWSCHKKGIDFRGRRSKVERVAEWDVEM